MNESDPTTLLSRLVGESVGYEASSGETRYGTIKSATYSLSGELAIVIHLTTRPGRVVLFGRPASELISRAQRGVGIVRGAWPLREEDTWQLCG